MTTALWVFWLDMAGVAIFALSGVVLACHTRMDPFGMLVLAAVTGIGGGTLRDLVLGVPVFWVINPAYLWVVVGTVGLSILGFHYIHRLTRTFLPVTDAFGLALFTIVGAHKALLLESPGVVAVLMGLLTGVAGGMTRDVLARRVPMVLRQEVYATASIAGGTSFVVLSVLGSPSMLAIGLGLTVTLGLRLAAIRWELALPTFAWIVTDAAAPADEKSTDTTPTSPPAGARTKARVKLIKPERSRRRKR